MSGSKLFLDTNIIIYLLNGDETLATFLNKNTLYISFVTQLELLSFPSINKKEQKQIEAFVNECKVVDINAAIKKHTINLRREKKLKLPDCIVVASAIYLDIPLITADKYFGNIAQLDCILYEVN